jgi:hypothetical protein
MSKPPAPLKTDTTVGRTRIVPLIIAGRQSEDKNLQNFYTP